MAPIRPALLLAVAALLAPDRIHESGAHPAAWADAPRFSLEPIDRQSVSTSDCTAAQRKQLEQALTGICRAVAQQNGACRKALAQQTLLTSFERQCARGVTVRCRKASCGQYLPKRVLYYGDDGTIEIGLAGFIGGPGCGGRENPMDGPAHTLAHEMAHAAGARVEDIAEKLAYDCRAPR